MPPKKDDELQVTQINHVAYRCVDAKETTDWYKEYLNMDLLVSISENKVPSTKDNDPYMHLFLHAGNGKDGPNILAFFELPKSPPMDVPICGSNTPNWTQHIAFQVEDEATLDQWGRKLKAKGLDIIGPTNHAIIKSIYFWDPNGHRLELTCWTATAAQMKQLKECAYPMVQEFAKTGQVLDTAAWLHTDEFNPTGLERVQFCVFAEQNKKTFPGLFKVSQPVGLCLVPAPLASPHVAGVRIFQSGPPRVEERRAVVAERHRVARRQLEHLRTRVRQEARPVYLCNGLGVPRRREGFRGRCRQGSQTVP
jgi:catechol 2,3-dioxygenase-like lactoylglutathione lyase family enzyme